MERTPWNGGSWLYVSQDSVGLSQSWKSEAMVSGNIQDVLGGWGAVESGFRDDCAGGLQPQESKAEVCPPSPPLLPGSSVTVATRVSVPLYPTPLPTSQSQARRLLWPHSQGVR